MKVVKKQDIENWKYNITCFECDSELEVEVNDLILERYDGDFREPPYEEYNTNCAVCKESLHIPIKYIPKLAQMEVKNRTKK